MVLSIILGAVGAIAAYIGVPSILSAVGFTKAGVAVGSIAAATQTSTTAAGSWFAIFQSAGVLGFATSTKVAISTAVGAVVSFVASMWPWGALL